MVTTVYFMAVNFLSRTPFNDYFLIFGISRVVSWVEHNWRDGFSFLQNLFCFAVAWFVLVTFP